MSITFYPTETTGWVAEGGFEFTLSNANAHRVITTLGYTYVDGDGIAGEAHASDLLSRIHAASSDSPDEYVSEKLDMLRALATVSVPMRQCECLANHVEPQAEIKAGTRVTYHGSIAEFEGEQFTARPCLLLDECDVDCVGYQLYRTDPTLAMSHVRRQSITPVA
jgi:hypothetical protein